MSARAIGILPALLLCSVSVASAQTEPPAESPKIEVGILTCDIEPQSANKDEPRDLECVFEPRGKQPSETYVGRIQKLSAGGATGDKQVMAWQVYSAAPAINVGALSGTYKGAVAPVGDGKDPNVYLVGGVDDTIRLLPVSESAGSVNLAGVVAELNLKAVKA